MDRDADADAGTGNGDGKRERRRETSTDTSRCFTVLFYILRHLTSILASDNNPDNPDIHLQIPEYINI
jgi:hypothetical protein